MNVDPVTMQLMNNYLITTAREMGIAMKNTSYSPLFNEGLDFSCAIFDEKAEMIAQAEFCPAHLGAIMYILKWTVRDVGIDNFHPGDVVIHNDPFRGGCHLPEFTAIRPVFHGTELAGFVCNIGHMTEVGGKVPGGFAGDATEVFQEGLRLPPVKIVKEGKDVEDIWNIILSNVRTPKNANGDIRAMIGSLEVGKRRLKEIIDKYGLPFFKQINEELKSYSERRMRAEIKEIPNGIYEFEDYVTDNDGVVDRPSKARVKLTIQDDSMVVDYTGSDKQAKGPVNCTYGVTASATYNAILHLTSKDIPSNDGAYRPIEIIAPLGTIVNVKYPGASVGGNSEFHPHLVMLIYGALAQVLPDRVSASDGGTSALLAYGGVHPETGDVFVNLTNEGCGWGGRASKDGNSVLNVPNGNCVLQPAEVLETRYPLIFEKVALNEGSAGPGKYRGGLGSIRQFRLTADEMTVSGFIEREKQEPWGLFGGKPGKRAAMLTKKAGTSTFRTFKDVYHVVCSGKFSGVVLKKGSSVKIVTSGGGGYGNPLERDFELIESDVREGLMTKGQATKEYQVVFKHNSCKVDIGATKNKRSEI